MLPDPHFGRPGTSFIEYLSAAAPELLPGRRPLPPGVTADLAPHGTTIIAATFADGVLMAGDRRATAGNVIAQRDVEKLVITDDYSVVGAAGTAGIASEMVRLYQVELEHYEKIEGQPLSLEGKANRLAAMVRGNLGIAMQGLVAVPIFAGYDEIGGGGRMFTYDPAGGCYEERGFTGVGSGSPYAKAALKKRWRADLTTDEAIRAAIGALYDAADDDTATGGPDLVRRLFPQIALVTAEGAAFVDDEQVAAVSEQVVADRHENPGG